MNLVRHRFQSPKVDGPDPTQIQPSAWNDGHVFSGGAAGDVLTRDPTDATYGAKWAPVPAGTPSGGNTGDLLTRDATVPIYGSKWAAPPVIPPGLPPGGVLGDVLVRDATVAIYGSKWVTPPTYGIYQSQPFNAADYSCSGAMTISTAAGNIVANRYAVIGKALIWQLAFSFTLAGTADSYVHCRLPGGFTIANGSGLASFGTNGAVNRAMIWYAQPGDTSIHVTRGDGVAWQLGAGSQIWLSAVIEIQ